ncbi:MAG: pentapeptide repeat-containing protein, partial [Thermosynechococcaceae cyanobacterium]
ALFAAFLFAANLFIPLQAAWSWVDSNTSNIILPITSVAIALVSALVLTRSMTGRIMSSWMALAGVAVTLILVATFLMGQPPVTVTVIVALALIATVLDLGLILIGNRVNRWSKISAKFYIFAVLISLVTVVILIFNPVLAQVSWWIIPLTLMIAVVAYFPSILSGKISLSGALIGSLIVPAGIAIFFVLVRASSFLDSTWTLAIAIAEGSILTAIIAWATIITIAVTVNLTWAEADNRTIAIVWTLLGTMPLIMGAVFVSLSAIPWLPALNLKLWSFLISVVVGTILATSILLLGTYIGWRALVKDKKFTAIRDLAITFMAQGGTSFRGANLTDANFTEATLKNADFRDTNLTRTRWFHAQKLYLACVGNSYLQFPQVQQLVITGIGQDQNFDNLNLQGINLQQSHLADASFIGTNLTEANLRQTDLSRAKLVKTQLDKADLFGACLTGAYIQDVEITSTTNLRGVECQYIFTRLPTNENRDPGRIPEDYRQIFKPGELVNFMHKSNTSPMGADLPR